MGETLYEKFLNDLLIEIKIHLFKMNNNNISSRRIELLLIPYQETILPLNYELNI